MVGQLPDKFVVKPTHGCDWVQIVTDKSTLDRTTLIETCYGWLKRSYYKEMLEWAYKDIKLQIIVEEFIDDGSGSTAPTDYKLFVFDASPRPRDGSLPRLSGQHHNRPPAYECGWDRPFQLVHINNVANAAHWETYVISGKPGQICLNGPPSRLFQPGDKVIVLALAHGTLEEAAQVQHKVVHVDDSNKILRIEIKPAATANFEMAGETISEPLNNVDTGVRSRYR
jgi:hypothetical protein